MAGVSHRNSSGGGEPADLTADRISNLPWNVLDIILGKLPITDTVRTSLLAKSWRYKWLSLSEFVLDSNEFSESLGCRDDVWGSIASIVNNFLLNHSDAIKKFVLKTYCASHYSDVYQWIHFLSKEGIEIFMLEEYGNELFMMSSHLFSFKQLKGLFLGSCALRIPPTFGKFNFLWELLLRDVAMSDEDLEHLIIACPALERLTLLSIGGLNHLKIRASNLKCLLIDYGYEDIDIEDGGNLVVVTVATTFLEREEEVALNWRSVIRSLSGLNSLLNLGLSGGLIRLLAADYGLDKFPLRNSSLTSLYLHCIRFESVEVFRVCLSFLSSCLNLQRLRFSVESAKGPKLILGFFQENRERFSFPNLRSVQMRYVSGMGSALDFLEFVGSHSPSLREVIILKDGKIDLPGTRIYNICSRLRRSCPGAEVQYLPAGPNCFM